MQPIFLKDKTLEDKVDFHEPFTEFTGQAAARAATEGFVPSMPALMACAHAVTRRSMVGLVSRFCFGFYAFLGVVFLCFGVFFHVFFFLVPLLVVSFV